MFTAQSLIKQIITVSRNLITFIQFEDKYLQSCVKVKIRKRGNYLTLKKLLKASILNIRLISKVFK